VKNKKIYVIFVLSVILVAIFMILSFFFIRKSSKNHQEVLETQKIEIQEKQDIQIPAEVVYPETTEPQEDESLEGESLKDKSRKKESQKRESQDSKKKEDVAEDYEVIITPKDDPSPVKEEKNQKGEKTDSQPGQSDENTPTPPEPPISPEQPASPEEPDLPDASDNEIIELPFVPAN